MLIDLGGGGCCTKCSPRIPIPIRRRKFEKCYWLQKNFEPNNCSYIESSYGKHLWMVPGGLSSSSLNEFSSFARALVLRYWEFQVLDIYLKKLCAFLQQTVSICWYLRVFSWNIYSKVNKEVIFILWIRNCGYFETRALRHVSKSASLDF